MNPHVKWGIFSALFLFGIAVALGLYLSHQKGDESAHFILEKDPNLTQEERAVYDERLGLAREWLENNPDAPAEEKFNYMMVEGFNLYGLGQFLKSKNVFLNASKISPEESVAYAALSFVALDMEDNKGALNYIQKAIELSPTNADYYKKMITIKKDRFGADSEELNGLYVDALVKTNNHIDIVTSYAKFAEESGKTLVAYEYWQKAIEIYPESASVYKKEMERLKKMMN
jgi:tetratricopeptide (TPR) repeat protein